MMGKKSSLKNKKIMVVYGDGIHDDTKSFQSYFDGKAKLIHQDGSTAPGNRTYKISKKLVINGQESRPQVD